MKSSFLFFITSILYYSKSPVTSNVIKQYWTKYDMLLKNIMQEGRKYEL